MWVFHYTDTHIYVFPLVLALCFVHNKKKLIGKLTTFLQFQEFIQSKDTSTFSVRCSPHNSKSKVGLILAKASGLRTRLNIDGSPISSRSHTHPSHMFFVFIITEKASVKERKWGVVEIVPGLVLKIDVTARSKAASWRPHALIYYCPWVALDATRDINFFIFFWIFLVASPLWKRKVGRRTEAKGIQKREPFAPRDTFAYWWAEFFWSLFAFAVAAAPPLNLEVLALDMHVSHTCAVRYEARLRTAGPIRRICSLQ